MDLAQCCEQLYAVTQIPLSIVNGDGTCLASWPPALNGIANPNLIVPGQTLRLPV